MQKKFIILKKFLENIKFIKDKNYKIIGYGSPAKATTALNFFGVSKEIDYIIEDNKLKQGKYLPGVNIPITNNKIVSENSFLLVLAWNFYNEIKKKNKDKFKQIFNTKSLESKNFVNEYKKNNS